MQSSGPEAQLAQIAEWVHSHNGRYITRLIVDFKNDLQHMQRITPCCWSALHNQPRATKIQHTIQRLVSCMPWKLVYNTLWDTVKRETGYIRV